MRHKKSRRTKLLSSQLLKKERTRSNIWQSPRPVNLQAYLVNAVLVMSVCVLLLWLYSYVAQQFSKKEAEEITIETILQQKRPYLDLYYPGGYKLFLIAPKKIYIYPKDNLPKELRIDWNELAVADVRPEEKPHREGYIRIQLPSLNYPPAQIDPLMLHALILKNNGAKVRVGTIGPWGIFVEMLEVYQNQTIAVIGLTE